MSRAISGVRCSPSPFVVPNVWLRRSSLNPDQRREADAAKARLTVPEGDHLTLLNVYNEYAQSASCVSLPFRCSLADCVEFCSFFCTIILMLMMLSNLNPIYSIPTCVL